MIWAGGTPNFNERTGEYDVFGEPRGSTNPLGYFMGGYNPTGTPGIIEEYSPLDDSLRNDYINDPSRKGATNFGEAKGASMTMFGNIPGTNSTFFQSTPDYIPDWLDAAVGVPQTLLAGLGTIGYQLQDSEGPMKGLGDWYEQMQGYTGARFRREDIQSAEDAWESGRKTEEYFNGPPNATTPTTDGWNPTWNSEGFPDLGPHDIYGLDVETGKMGWADRPIDPDGTGLNTTPVFKRWVDGKSNWEKGNEDMVQAQLKLTTDNNQGLSNLGYGSSQLAGTSPAGLEKQNLDYAMAQLGMMTGNYGSGTDNLPGWSAPYGGATADGGYTNPFTGTDSAGRTPDDPYYGGLSDVGTADPNNWSYGNVNDYYNWGGDVLGGMFGPIVGAFGDAAFGINPTPGAGNYIPGTDTYIPTYLENFEGAGEKVTDLYDIGTGDQRDMLIEQGFLGGEGMLGGAVADPDQQFFETKSEALNFYNDGVAVANPGDPGTAEAVGVANDMLSLEGSSFSSQEEAQVVANFGFGSDEHMAVIDSALNGFQAFSSNLEGVPEEEFNKQAQSALKAQQNQYLTDYL